MATDVKKLNQTQYSSLWKGESVEIKRKSASLQVTITLADICDVKNKFKIEGKPISLTPFIGVIKEARKGAFVVSEACDWKGGVKRVRSSEEDVSRKDQTS